MKARRGKWEDTWMAISRRANKLAQSLLAFALSAALIAEPAMAQAQDNPAAPTAPATDAEANAGEPAAGESFSRDELEKLLAPIALYPDPLLAQMLPASAYPRSSRRSVGLTRTRRSSPKTIIPASTIRIGIPR
jgi:hypothetical protein